MVHRRSRQVRVRGSRLQARVVSEKSLGHVGRGKRGPCLAVLALLAACGQASGSPCGKCGEGEFCCVSRCQPLGTVCGGSDAGVPITDASPPLDADAASMDPCASLPGAMSVRSGCLDAHTVTSCPPAASNPCTGTNVCVTWVDRQGTQRGSCVASNEAMPCDPMADAPRCDGVTAHDCVANDYPDQPHGYWVSSDCSMTWAPDATCQVVGAAADGGVAEAVCTSPSDMSCDPSTFVPSCSAGKCQYVSADAGVVRPFCSQGASTRVTGTCVQNVTTGNMPVCLPLDAQPSSEPATMNEVVLGCADFTTLHVERYGYEYNIACGVIFSTSGDDGGLSSERQTQCYAPPPNEGPAACVDPENGVPPACSASFVESCFDDNRKWTCGGRTSGSATVAPCMYCRRQSGGVACTG